MALTAKGLLIGRAAQAERRDTANYLEEKAEAERLQRISDAKECQEICEWIRPFFIAEKWQEWWDAGPDDNAGFFAYAKAEWQNIYNEFTVEPL